MTRYIHMVLKKFLTGCGLWISLQKSLLIAGKKISAVCFLSTGGGSGSSSLRKKSGKFARKSLVFFDFRAILDKKLCT
ncbi:hypothetical protein BTI62_08160 [Lactobacillus delbrueckii subsp. bulgaricus]|nr:hypothetical protein [Lactobacillus delbrueckii subsp. bulgaricus]MBT8923496.1 hypothetical protein [Lactobacillus delbrueckii subsp. bulgaricus]